MKNRIAGSDTVRRIFVEKNCDYRTDLSAKICLLILSDTKELNNDIILNSYIVIPSAHIFFDLYLYIDTVKTFTVSYRKQTKGTTIMYIQVHNKKGRTDLLFIVYIPLFRLFIFLIVFRCCYCSSFLFSYLRSCLFNGNGCLWIEAAYLASFKCLFRFYVATVPFICTNKLLYQYFDIYIYFVFIFNIHYIFLFRWTSVINNEHSNTFIYINSHTNKPTTKIKTHNYINNIKTCESFVVDTLQKKSTHFSIIIIMVIINLYTFIFVEDIHRTKCT